jgi:hypothetical protein
MTVETTKQQDSLLICRVDAGDLNVKELRRETLTFRLSKQQKYILQLLLNRKVLDANEHGFYYKNNYLDSHNHISRKVAKKFNREFTNSHYASFSRSIKTLEKNGLIENISGLKILTSKGKLEAETRS